MTFYEIIDRIRKGEYYSGLDHYAKLYNEDFMLRRSINKYIPEWTRRIKLINSKNYISLSKDIISTFYREIKTDNIRKMAKKEKRALNSSAYNNYQVREKKNTDLR